jgi:hypothetical protein
MEEVAGNSWKQFRGQRKKFLNRFDNLTFPKKWIQTLGKSREKNQNKPCRREVGTPLLGAEVTMKMVSNDFGLGRTAWWKHPRAAGQESLMTPPLPR